MWQIVITAFVCIRHFRLLSQYVRKTRRFPNVAVPVATVDKFLWRKVFDRNPLFIRLSDKILAKQYALNKCPDLLTSRVLWEGNNSDDIPENLLAGPGVLKSNHGSGHLVSLDGNPVDRTELKAKTDRWLARPYGQGNGEWGYRDINRMIFIEELIKGDNGDQIIDFKTYVMNGKVQHIQCMYESNGPHPATSRYDRDGTLFEAHHSSKYTYLHADPPSQFGRVVDMAERLGAGFDHMRCDFYVCGDDIYFCEMTIYPVAGFPDISGKLEGAWKSNWDIRHSWFLSTPQQGWRGAYARWLKARVDRDHAA